MSAVIDQITADHNRRMSDDAFGRDVEMSKAAKALDHYASFLVEQRMAALNDWVAKQEPFDVEILHKGTFSMRVVLIQKEGGKVIAAGRTFEAAVLNAIRAGR